MASKNRETTETLAERIERSKRENEELKAKLQNLIDSGINSSLEFNKFVDNAHSTEPIPETSHSNKVQIVKSYDVDHSETVNKPNQAKLKDSKINKDIPDKKHSANISPKKNRSYNVEEAREYMRKQREKRLEQMKSKTKENVNQTELRKQKIKELHRKQLELVTRNVNAKRERSRSRERGDYIRPDTNVNFPVKQRSVSNERLNNVPSSAVLQPTKSLSCNTLNKSSNQLCPKMKSPHTKSKSMGNANNIKPHITYTEKSTLLVENRIDNIPINNTQLKCPDLLYPPDHPLYLFNVDNQSKNTESLAPQIDLKENPNKHLATTEIVKGSSKSSSSKDKTTEKTKNSIKILSNVTLRDPPKEFISNRLDHKSRDKSTESEKILNPKSVVSDIFNYKTHKDSKETQTNIAEPPWLKHTAQSSDPFNFINAVRRKLQDAISTTKTMNDVGIQAENTFSETLTSKKNAKENISKGTDLKSFISHKCLDPESIKHLELRSQHSSKRQLTSKDTRSKTKLDTDSESNTSKNISDIASESIVTSKHKLTQLNSSDLKINTETIDNMKLQINDVGKLKDNSLSDLEEYFSDSQALKHCDSKKSHKLNNSYGGQSLNSKISSKQNILTIEDNLYTPDFNTSTTDIETNLSRSRESIISYNRSGYNKISPAASPVQSAKNVIKSPEKSISEKNTDPQSNFNNSNVSVVIQVASQNNHTSGDDIDTNDLISLKTQTENSLNKTPDESRLSKTSNVENSVKNGDKKTLMKNISIRSFDKHGEKKTNEIHLKFEAEIHLLNDFNESLKHFAEVEKAFNSLRTKEDIPNTANIKIMQNQDTQTSARTQSPTTSKTSNAKVTPNILEDSKSHISTINYTRGSDINEDVNSIILNSSVPKVSEDNTSIVSLGFDFSQNTSSSKGTRLSSKVSGTNNKTKSTEVRDNFENLFPKDFAGMSLGMFDQLIRDEDIRLENLKTILKIREQALLDRTKAELAWLEIQRKHLKETGKLQEASLVKKKQRGILLKHQQESHEMHRLKQMQKAESIERKTILKAQRNIIKHQLSTENMLSKIKMSTPRKGKHTGPLKVIQTQNESIRSETSVSIKSSDIDVQSVTSRSYSVVSKVSEVSERREKVSDEGQPAVQITQVRRTLLMRESALQKRRRAAEELLQWHEKLLEEEQRIKQLEDAASVIISQIPNAEARDERKHKFGGHQLNQLWFNLTGSVEKKFKDDKVYPMSQMALERFCKSAKEYSHKSKGALKKVETGDLNSIKTSDNVNDLGILGINQNIPQNIESPSDSVQPVVSNIPSEVSANEYTSDFDVDVESINEINVQESNKGKSDISSISELIDNFSKVKTDISSRRLSHDSSSESSESLKTDPSVLGHDSQEISVIETTKASKDLPKSVQEDKSSLIPVDETASKISEENILQDAEESTSIPSVGEVMTASNETSASPTTKTSENVEQTGISEQASVPSDESKNSSLNNVIIEEPNTPEEKSEPSAILDPSKSVNSNISIVELNSEEINISSESPKNKVAIPDEKEILLENQVNKEDNILEEKEQDSLSSILSISTDRNEEDGKDISEEKSSTSDKIERQNEENQSHSVNTETEEINTAILDQTKSNKASEVSDKSVKSEVSLVSKASERNPVSSETSVSPRSGSEKKPGLKIDVKKRVSEILADASPVPREEKSPRIQDLYTTTYDLVSPAGSPDSGSPTKENKLLLPKDLFGNEAEELLKKQLAIEQEIKEITEQQQKEQLPLLYVREIPNKPPPPYTPPSSNLSSLSTSTILPTSKEVEEITKYSAKIIHKAHLNNNLEKIMISDNTLNLIAKNIDKSCYKFVFDLCKEIAIEHYNQFKVEEVPVWLQVTKKPQLAVVQPLNANDLEKHMNKKLQEMFGFKKLDIRENTIMKWSRKKRDHVDEVLVTECQTEESQWTNFAKDELIIKSEVTNDIMSMLLKETADVFKNALSKSNYFQ